MSRLWDKGQGLDREMFELTVGNDYLIDRALVSWDALGSAAHVRMLAEVGLFPGDQLPAMLAELQAIYEEGKAGTFEISPDLEDVHTAIESRLVAKLGEAGLRVHAARSRNDQVLLATRLYSRQFLNEALEELLTNVELLFRREQELGSQIFPGYTHMQTAMPSSFSLWAHAWIEGLLSFIREGFFWAEEVNKNPLGSAAGFGVPLPIRRERVAELLGFAGVQRSVIDCNNSRGRCEERLLHWASGAAAIYERFACDFMLFSTAEFGFFSLPVELTTGSSIMPQKRNPDLAELLRARPSRVRAAADELFSITRKLPSSYHRDLQYTKEPFIRGANEFLACCRMFRLVLANVILHPERMQQAMTDDLFATYAAYREVMAGKPFREAYREVADKVTSGTLERGDLEADFAPIAQATRQGLDEALRELRSFRIRMQQLSAAQLELSGRVFTL